MEKVKKEKEERVGVMAQGGEEYNKKRDFENRRAGRQIVEPVTSEGDDSESLRFVVQHHIAQCTL